ncbi:hypothetical protein NPIL_573641, partial [Nephila pilipes]
LLCTKYIKNDQYHFVKYIFDLFYKQLSFHLSFVWIFNNHQHKISLHYE